MSRVSRLATVLACLFLAAIIGCTSTGQRQASPAAPNATELAEVRQLIAGRENEPAETVFKNIQVLKGMPAGRLVSVMDIAFSRALGVRCTHCHQDEWDHDTLPAKEIARDMWRMNRRLNRELLQTIKGLEGRDATANCTTCHRGAVKPALNLGPV
jgi:hypothetical protein